MGDVLELAAGTRTHVRYEVIMRAPFTVHGTNARPNVAAFELILPDGIVDASATVGERKGRKIWRVDVPANGEARFNYALELDGRRPSPWRAEYRQSAQTAR